MSTKSGVQADESSPGPRARLLTVEVRGDGQRLDNFLLRECPGIPKTRLYKAIRKGEVRVNKGRARPERRLQSGDVVRLPPFAEERRAPAVAPSNWQQRLADAVVYEDKDLLVVNKPAGIAVHGGSGLQFGLIETLRSMRPEHDYLELVHRLDRDTSGLLLVARRPTALRRLHALLRTRGEVDKRYLALVAGRWPRYLGSCAAPLKRDELSSGERMVRIARDGKESLTEFSVQRVGDAVSLIEARPITGRTHQIRVHAAHLRHPVLGDAKYGDERSALTGRELGLRRLFLHACELRFQLDGRPFHFRAPLGDELEGVIARAFS
ncbi:MAG: RluA family pseudouridine synthase [Pseudomonadota bacterium]